MQTKASPAALIVGFLILVLMAATVFFVSQRGTGLFDIRKRASTPGGVATIAFNPATSTTQYDGDTFTVDLMLNTADNPISGVALRFIYNYTSSDPDLDIVDADPAVPGTQIQSFAQAMDPTFTTNVNLAQAQPEGKMFIDFAATTSAPAGYTNSAGVKLATITFKARKPTNKVIEHDPDRSQVTKKLDSGGILDILQTIPSYPITIIDDTELPTVTITSGPEQGSTVTASQVTFTWEGTDAPARSSNTTPTLRYSYRFDDEQWSPFSTETSASKSLTNAKHVFEVRARDGSNNVTIPTIPDSKRRFTINLAPHINDINPVSGNPGTVVTINGYNFGSTKATVKFGDIVVRAENILSWTDTQIQAKAPAGGTGDVVVMVNDLVSNGVPFTLGTAIRVVFNFQGIGEDRGERLVTIVVNNETTGFIERATAVAAQWNPERNAYRAIVPLNDSITDRNNYTVSIDDTSRLRKRFTGVSIRPFANNTLVKTAEGDRVRVADFNEDNKLTIADFALMMTKITSISTPVDDTNAIYDLNADQVLTIADIALLLSNYTALEVPGDPE